MFNDRLKRLRESRGLTQKEISLKLEMPQRTYSSYENNEREPNSEILKKMSFFFGVTIDYLLGIENTNNNQLSSAENLHIQKYRTLDEYGKRAINELLDTEYERCTSVPEEIKPEIVHIKLAQLPASAGTGVDLYEENYEIMSVRACDLTKQADFAVRVSGDSMESTFFDGDILLIESMPYINVGDIGIFVVNGDGFVKEYGGDRLISHNDKYPDIKLTEHDVVICSGRVIGALEESDFID